MVYLVSSNVYYLYIATISKTQWQQVNKAFEELEMAYYIAVELSVDMKTPFYLVITDKIL